MSAQERNESSGMLHEPMRFNKTSVGSLAASPQHIAVRLCLTGKRPLLIRGEAQPRRKRLFTYRTESRRLSAVCGGEAAIEQSGLSE